MQCITEHGWQRRNFSVHPAVRGATSATKTDRMAPFATIHYHCLLTLHISSLFFIKSFDLFRMNHKHHHERAQSRTQDSKTAAVARNTEESLILVTFTLRVTSAYSRGSSTLAYPDKEVASSRWCNASVCCLSTESHGCWSMADGGGLYVPLARI